jgi:hypothetical protein
MLTRRHVQRSVALLASAGATAALALLPAGAHANTQAEYAAVGNAHANYIGPTSGGSCALTSGTDDPFGHVYTFRHGTKRSSVNLSATFTSSDNGSDQTKVKGHIDTSLTVKRKHNDLSGFAMTAGGTLGVSHTRAGSACEATGSMLAELPELQFTEHKKGTLTITRDTKKPNSFTQLILVNESSDEAVALDVFQGTKSHVVSTATLKPGVYDLEETEIGLAIGNAGIFKSSTLSSRATQTVHLQGQFKPAKH